MKTIVEQLSELSDSAIIDLILRTKQHQTETARAKTNRYGLYKKLPKNGLDSLVADAHKLSDKIRDLEHKHGFTGGEIRKEIVRLLYI